MHYVRASSNSHWTLNFTLRSIAFNRMTTHTKTKNKSTCNSRTPNSNEIKIRHANITLFDQARHRLQTERGVRYERRRPKSGSKSLINAASKSGSFFNPSVNCGSVMPRSSAASANKRPITCIVFCAALDELAGTKLRTGPTTFPTSDHEAPIIRTAKEVEPLKHEHHMPR